MNECSASALGVAHQALEEINPSGDNILIQGKRWRLCSRMLFIVSVMYCGIAGCGPIGLFGIGIAKAMGATKV